MDAYRRGVAALLKHMGRSADFCCAHKEYAPSRKPHDPRFDMDAFRAAVAGILSGTAPAPTLIPAVEPAAASGSAAPRPTLRRGVTAELVKVIQRKAGIADDGIFGGATEAAVREFQRARGLVPDGIVGPKTWAAIDAT